MRCVMSREFVIWGWTKGSLVSIVMTWIVVNWEEKKIQKILATEPPRRDMSRWGVLPQTHVKLEPKQE